MEEKEATTSPETVEPGHDQQVADSCSLSNNNTPFSEDVLLTEEPQTRAEFQKYYCYLTLDPNTAYRELLLSEDNRKAELTDMVQTYPDHPDRFSHLYQVLCAEALSGRSYWEVEWKDSIEIAVAYKDLSRTGYYDECAFGCNDKSWSLDLNKNNKCFRHNDEETEVPEPLSFRVGVYLDHKAGLLSFHCITDTRLQLLHKVHTTFTEPLYPGLWVAGSAQLCNPE